MTLYSYIMYGGVTCYESIIRSDDVTYVYDDVTYVYDTLFIHYVWWRNMLRKHCLFFFPLLIFFPRKITGASEESSRDCAARGRKTK